MNDTRVQDRMRLLVQPIEQQIHACEDDEDLLMLACVMLQHAGTLLEHQLGPAGKRTILLTAANGGVH